MLGTFVVANQCEIDLILFLQKLEMQVNVYVCAGGNLDKQYVSVASYFFMMFKGLFVM